MERCQALFTIGGFRPQLRTRGMSFQSAWALPESAFELEQRPTLAATPIRDRLRTAQPSGWSYLSSSAPLMMNFGDGDDQSVASSPAFPNLGVFSFARTSKTRAGTNTGFWWGRFGACRWLS